MRRFTIHPTRVVRIDTPAPITYESLSTPRFSGPPPRPLREDERMFISGAFTLGELERIIAWARSRG